MGEQGELTKFFVGVGSDFDDAGFLKAGASIGDLIKSVAGMDAGFVALGGTVAAMAVGAFKAFDALTSAAGEQETAQNKLNESLRQAGIFSKELSDYYVDLAREIQDNTTFTDEQVMSVEQMILRFGVLPSKVESVTRAVLNLSKGYDLDLGTATRMIVKANDGMAASFQRVGIHLDSNRLKTEGLDYVTEEITKHFGSAAENELNTYEGKLKNLKNRQDDLKEAIGERLLPTAVAFLGTALKIVTALDDWGQKVGVIQDRRTIVDEYKDQLKQVNSHLEYYYALSREGHALSKTEQDDFDLTAKKRKSLNELIKEGTEKQDAHNKVVLAGADAADTIAKELGKAEQAERDRKEAIERSNEASNAELKAFNDLVEKMDEYVNAFQNSLAGSFEKILTEGQSLSDAMGTIAGGIQSAIITSISKAAAEWVVQMAIMNVATVAAFAPIFLALAALYAFTHAGDTSTPEDRESYQNSDDMATIERRSTNDPTETNTVRVNTREPGYNPNYLYMTESDAAEWQRMHDENLAYFNNQPASYDTGVEDFAGGLAYIHKDELLANLPKGTNVFNKYETSQILAGAGGGVGDINITIPPIPDAAYAHQMAELIGQDIIDIIKGNRRI